MPTVDQDIISIGDSSSGPAGVTEVIAGDGIAVDATAPDKPVVSATGVQSLASGTGISIDNTDPQNPTVSAVPLEVVGRRISATEVLTATAQNIIISEITPGPITLTLALSSAYPTGTKWFMTRFINASSHVVTIETADSSEFYKGRGNKINMVPSVAGTSDITLSAFNFAADGPYPARSGWAIQVAVPVSMYALYSGNVDMTEFEGAGKPIAFREGTETDNDEIMELESVNETRILLKKGGRTRVNVDLEVDATQTSPPWNIAIKGRVFRNSAYVDIGLISEGGTGNFGGEDVWVSKDYYFDAQPGDELEQLLISSGVTGTLKTSTVKVYTDQ
jgi:hypothetical protein